jgi:hypothetical protein
MDAGVLAKVSKEMWQCGNCLYLVSGADGVVCGRYSPQVISGGENKVVLTLWPGVKKDDRCGEFEYAPGKAPEVKLSATKLHREVGVHP